MLKRGFFCCVILMIYGLCMAAYGYSAFLETLAVLFIKTTMTALDVSKRKMHDYTVMI